jgi:type II secretion system protein J
MSKPRRNFARGGFTLLELVIATSMIAMLSLSLYACMNVGLRASRSIERNAAASREAAVVFDMLEREFTSIPPPSGTLAGPFTAYALGTSGASADYVEFYSLGGDARDAAAWGQYAGLAEGMRRVQIRLRTDQSPPCIVKRVERNLLSQTALQTPPDEVIARDVKSFSLRYYDGSTWTDEWDSTQLNNVLPVAVAVTVEFNQPSRANPAQPYKVMRIIPIPTGAVSQSGGFSF